MANGSRKTPLYEKHLQLNGKIIEFANYLLPVWYQSPDLGSIKEHLAVRNSAGMFDLSHMGEIFISGERAFDFLQYVLCNDLRKIGNGGCQYTLLPTEEGGVVDDLIVYQFNPEHYLLVVNAINIENDFNWLCKWNDEKKYQVSIDNRSYEYGLLAVQGPRSEDVLTEAGFENVHCILPFTFRRVKHKEIEVFLSATGYTGERGFELICKNDYLVPLWEELWQAGEKSNVNDQSLIKPVGLGARDSLRVEAGYCLYSHELNLETSVLEANLGWTVNFHKEFVGDKFLLEQGKSGVKKLLFGLKVEREYGTPRQGARIFTLELEEIGYVTSGVYSPVLECSIALCFLKQEYAKPKMNVLVEARGKNVPAILTKPPFVKHRLYH